MDPHMNDDKYRDNRISDLEHEFHHAMLRVADFANSLGFGQRFRQMLSEYGGLETARRLLAAPQAQSGLVEMYSHNAIHMSMEAFVIKPQFQPLFTDAEIAEAHRRLEELGYLIED